MCCHEILFNIYSFNSSFVLNISELAKNDKQEKEPVDSDLVEPADAPAADGEAGIDSAHAVRATAPQIFFHEEVMSPTWYDEKRERRILKLGKLKRRGKGPPKKGSGKRATKKK